MISRKVTDIFNNSASLGAAPGVSFKQDPNNPFENEAQQDQAPQKSILESIAPDKDFTVNTKPPSDFKVNATQDNAASLVEPNNQALTSVKDDIQDVKADIKNTIEDAQKQVLEATKEAGYDGADIFPDNRIAASNEAGVVAQAGVAAATGAVAVKGMGSMATFTESAQTAEMFAGDRKGGSTNKEQALAEIEAVLRAKSSQPEDTRAGQSGPVGGTSPKESEIDWNRVFDEQEDPSQFMEDLMSIDPDNPSPDLVPEYAALDQLEEDIDRTLENNNLVELAVEKGEIAQIGEDEPAYTAPEVELFSDSLSDVNGMTVSPQETQDLQTEAKAELARIFKLKDYKPEPENAATFSAPAA